MREFEEEERYEKVSRTIRQQPTWDTPRLNGKNPKLKQKREGLDEYKDIENLKEQEAEKKGKKEYGSKACIMRHWISVWFSLWFSKTIRISRGHVTGQRRQCGKRWSTRWTLHILLLPILCLILLERRLEWSHVHLFAHGLHVLDIVLYFLLVMSAIKYQTSNQ